MSFIYIYINSQVRVHTLNNELNLYFTSLIMLSCGAFRHVFLTLLCF